MGAIRQDGAEGPAQARSLVWHGALMTALGLLSGFTTMFAPAPRAALTAHTIGVLQGTMLFALAGAWHLLHGSPRVRRAIKYTLLAGLYANWLGAQLSALWSAARSMFIPQHAERMPAGRSRGWTSRWRCCSTSRCSSS